MAAAAACVVAAVIASTGVAGGASSSTVVGATVPSATNLDASACASGVNGRTHFGTVLPGSSVTTTIDCTVVFGSSNDTSMLRMSQADGLDAAMWRAPTGALATSFDADGIRLDTIGASSAAAVDSLVQPDGKIVVVGDASISGTWDFLVARYTPDGQLDTSFDVDGIVTTPIGTASDSASGVAIQPDGKLVVTGQAGLGSGNYATAVVRYNADGSLDTSFDGDGKVTTDTGVQASVGWETGVDVMVQPDGRIVVGGTGWSVPDSGQAFSAIRYRANGSLDPTFSGDGIALQAAGSVYDEASAALLQADGRILVAGYSDNSGDVLSMVRWNADGTLDTGFDGDGIYLQPAGTYRYPQDLAQQPDGKLLIGGYQWNTNYDFLVERRNLDGSLDTTFAGTGRATTPIGTGSDGAMSLALQGDGRIVTAGWSNNGTNNDFAYARFNADGTLDAGFDLDGRVARPAAGVADYAQATTIASDGRIVAAGFSGSQLALQMMSSVPVADYDDDNVGSDSNWSEGAGTFGACLRSLAGTGAIANWTVNAACGAGNGVHWNPVPATSAATGSKVATSSTATTTSVTANLRFGLRTSASQPAGDYVAPVTLTVLAPDA